MKHEALEELKNDGAMVFQINRLSQEKKQVNKRRKNTKFNSFMNTFEFIVQNRKQDDLHSFNV